MDQNTKACRNLTGRSIILLGFFDPANKRSRKRHQTRRIANILWEMMDSLKISWRATFGFAAIYKVF